MQVSILDEAKAARDAAHKEQGLLLDQASSEKRNFSDVEDSKFRALNTRKAGLDERIAQLELEAKREAAAAEVRRTVGVGNSVPFGGSTNDGLRGGTYHAGREGPSYFADLVSARNGNGDAIDRLRTNNNEVRTGTPLGSFTPGSGTDFVPPLWLSEYVEVARGAGVFSTLVHQEPMPPHTNTLSLPRLRTGTEVGIQSAEHVPVTNTEPTTDLISAPVCTTAGYNVLSQQLLDTSPLYSGQTFDSLILKDLSADWVSKLDQQCLWGTGAPGSMKGYITYVEANPTLCNVTTWTTSSPSPEGLFGQIGSTISDINMSRLAAPTGIVMSPRRWAALSSAVDGSGRPYVNVQGGQGFNSLAQASAVVSDGQVGSIQGLPVYTDVNVPVDKNGTEDVVLVAKLDDIYLWQSPIQTDIFPQPYAADLSVMVRLYSYSSLIVNRYPKSLGLITGTGLVPPVFQVDAVTPSP
jgi:HK97 family phage major capsid protein